MVTPKGIGFVVLCCLVTMVTKCYYDKISCIRNKGGFYKMMCLVLFAMWLDCHGNVYFKQCLFFLLLILLFVEQM